MPPVTVHTGAQWPWVPSIDQNLQPITGNGDVSKWVKNSRVGRKTPDKQTAQWPWEASIALNLKPFTGNGDVSIWVKNSRVGCKTPNKQTKQIYHIMLWISNIHKTRVLVSNNSWYWFSFYFFFMIWEDFIMSVSLLSKIKKILRYDL